MCTGGCWRRVSVEGGWGDPRGLPVVVKVAAVQRLTHLHPRLTLALIGSRAGDGRAGQPLLTEQRSRRGTKFPAVYHCQRVPRGAASRGSLAWRSLRIIFLLLKSVIKYTVPHIANGEQPIFSRRTRVYISGGDAGRGGPCGSRLRQPSGGVARVPQAAGHVRSARRRGAYSLC